MHESLLSYIDPVSGSILLQSILAGAVGAIVGFRRSIGQFWRRLMRTRSAGTPE